ncbi:MAG: flagellar biosynthesis protein FlhF [Nitrospiraceae bacterium]|nr:flagellar biosynthesis protein FlhF [Nitrospiraceae bacterium]MDA8090858.1 flagellar biosynthesis protein FlhF [Nitrospiraceae bacterium]
MKIRKFKAKNFAEALELVRKELSEDAVILSSEEKSGVRPFVEVTAAVDYDLDRAPGQAASESAGSAADRAEAGFQRFRDELSGQFKSEISELKAVINEMKSGGAFSFGPSMDRGKKALLNYLRERKIRDEFALRLCGKAKDPKDLLQLITADLKTKREQGGKTKKAFMLIGPTGVGKTTTVAKLCAKAIKEGKKAAIINLDTYRIGAGEQARIYARIMGIPLATASTPAELRVQAAGFAKTRDVIFIDTTGRNPRDDSYIEYIGDMCSAVPADLAPMELHLLMSASSDDEFMMEAYASYKRLPLDCISFTKVDEAVRFGSIYNLQMVYGKPVAYLATGQRVPDDIEFLNEQMLGNLILAKGCYKC